jgi:DNA processing protein
MTTTGRALSRLGLLCVGGGAKVRRLAAAAAGADFFADLRARGAPTALLRDAEDAARNRAPTVLERARANGWRWIVPEDREFPTLLRHSADPPLGLFVRGTLAARPAAAIVGARRATAYGLRAARTIAEGLAANGGVVVSGMARGIDGAAHQGALEGGGPTWAVWGAGPDTVYPREHAKLADEIAENGALITEYLPGTPPRKHHFPERNRIVAGLVTVVVVVEAAARSGALNTARQALDEDRDVMVVPGSIFSELSVGPHGLLRLGAQPLTTPRDLVEELGLTWNDEARSAASPHPLADHLAEEEAVPADVLAERLGKPVEQLLAYLVQLEVEGWLTQDSAGRFRRAGGR